MRINARLDDEAQAHISYLTQATGQSVSRWRVRRWRATTHNSRPAKPPRSICWPWPAKAAADAAMALPCTSNIWARS